MSRTIGMVLWAFLAAAGFAKADPAVTSQAALDALPELPDVVEGARDAPSTIIEYGSLTCSHCAAFHAKVWPELKAKYVDKGLVKFTFREFPLDPRAAAAFLLARCAGPDRRDEAIDVLFDHQAEWAFVAEAVEPMRKLAATFGVEGQAFDDCVENRTLYNEINESRDNAIKALDIKRTPTFFVNGRKLVGEASVEDFEQLLNMPRN